MSLPRVEGYEEAGRTSLASSRGDGNRGAISYQPVSAGVAMASVYFVG